MRSDRMEPNRHMVDRAARKRCRGDRTRNLPPRGLHRPPSGATVAAADFQPLAPEPAGGAVDDGNDLAERGLAGVGFDQLEAAAARQQADLVDGEDESAAVPGQTGDLAAGRCGSMRRQRRLRER